MTAYPETLPDGSPVGWRVIDPDGNVVSSGPLIELEMVAGLGESEGI